LDLVAARVGFALDLLVFFTACAHISLAPYTKVEESFNLHATHDVISYGMKPGALSNYDHNTFPGAVPRTFIGSVLLASSTQAFTSFMATLAPKILDKVEIQKYGEPLRNF
ncbi:hypothetical protein H0H87_000867, partial [Tephrocybe sp. NHM501043]